MMRKQEKQMRKIKKKIAKLIQEARDIALAANNFYLAQVAKGE